MSTPEKNITVVIIVEYLFKQTITYDMSNMPINNLNRSGQISPLFHHHHQHQWQQMWICKFQAKKKIQEKITKEQEKNHYHHFANFMCVCVCSKTNSQDS